MEPQNDIAFVELIQNCIPILQINSGSKFLNCLPAADTLQPVKNFLWAIGENRYFVYYIKLFFSQIFNDAKKKFAVAREKRFNIYIRTDVIIKRDICVKARD